MEGVRFLYHPPSRLRKQGVRGRAARKRPGLYPCGAYVISLAELGSSAALVIRIFLGLLLIASLGPTCHRAVVRWDPTPSRKARRGVWSKVHACPLTGTCLSEPCRFEKRRCPPPNKHRNNLAANALKMRPCHASMLSSLRGTTQHCTNRKGSSLRLCSECRMPVPAVMNLF